MENENKDLVNVTTKLGERITEAQINILCEAVDKDPKYIADLQKQLKDTFKEYTKYESAVITYQNELMKTKKELNHFKQNSNKWDNKNKARQFHYDGVAPVLKHIGITEPMAIPLLYFFAFLSGLSFLATKTWQATIGNILSGAQDGNRPAMVRGYLYTLAGVLVTFGVSVGIYFVLLWLGIL